MTTLWEVVTKVKGNVTIREGNDKVLRDRCIHLCLLDRIIELLKVLHPIEQREQLHRRLLGQATAPCEGVGAVHIQ